MQPNAYCQTPSDVGRSATRVLLCTLEGWEYVELPVDEDRERTDVLLAMGFLGSSPTRPGM